MVYWINRYLGAYGYRQYWNYSNDNMSLLYGIYSIYQWIRDDGDGHSTSKNRFQLHILTPSLHNVDTIGSSIRHFDLPMCRNIYNLRSIKYDLAAELGFLSISGKHSSIHIHADSLHAIAYRKCTVDILHTLHVQTMEHHILGTEMNHVLLQQSLDMGCELSTRYINIFKSGEHGNTYINSIRNSLTRYQKYRRRGYHVNSVQFDATVSRILEGLDLMYPYDNTDKLWDV